MLNQILDITESDDEKISRRITVIHGMPFYQSSGQNSSYSGTWFPFLGIEEKNHSFYAKGTYIKPYLPLHDHNIAPLLSKLFPNTQFSNAMLHQRFGSLTGILISSWLSGGLWETPAGKTLKGALAQHYPAFYQHWSAPIFKPIEHQYSSMQSQEINTWICQQAKIGTIDGLNQKFQKEVASLSLLNRPAKTTLLFNYQVNKDNLGSIMDTAGNRRSARIKKRAASL